MEVNELEDEVEEAMDGREEFRSDGEEVPARFDFWVEEADEYERESRPESKEASVSKEFLAGEALFDGCVVFP